MKDCVRKVGFDCARDCAAIGWSNLKKAVVKPSLAEMHQACGASSPSLKQEEIQEEIPEGVGEEHKESEMEAAAKEEQIPK